MVNLYLVILDLNFLLKISSTALSNFCNITAVYPFFSKKFLILYLVFHHLLLLVSLTYFSHPPHYSISFFFFYKCKKQINIDLLLYYLFVILFLHSFWHFIKLYFFPIYNTSSHHHF